MKFSIVIPIFNVAPYIKDCINSLVAQSYQDWECICVDDGSTDDSARLLENLICSLHEKRVRLLRQKNQGVCVARQRGLELSSGEWVVFLDSDDWVDENYLDIMYSKIATGRYDIIWTGYKLNSENYERTYLQEGSEDVISHAKALMDESILGTLWCRAFRRQFLCENGLGFFNPNLHWQEDLCFISECIRCEPHLGYARGSAYHYRQRDGSAMHGGARNDIMALIYIQRQLDRNFYQLNCESALLLRRKWTKLAACKHIRKLGLRRFSALFPDVRDVDDLPVNIFIKLTFKWMIEVVEFLTRKV